MENDQQETSASQMENCPEEMVPRIGMRFNSEQDAYDFYNAYAGKIGFSIQRNNCHYVGTSSTIKTRTFCCFREGARRVDKRSDTADKNKSFSRSETRCMCQASMKINLIDGFYFVYHFVAEHNHNLATIEQNHQLRSQRKIDDAQIARIEVAKSVGISTKAAIDLLAKEVGGIENLGFTRVDVKNRLYTKRSLKIHQGDTGGVLEYLEKKTSEDAKFFYSIQVDDDDLITNIFWANAKMIVDYESYGEVVGFDTTYRKLDSGRPLGLLVGVNNHKKTTIFGAALLYDETTESFIWLFRTFLIVMSGKKPRTILTDEDAAMAKAIRIVLPDTHHRLCVWHMNQNACKHLAAAVKDYKKFNIEFQKCIYDQEEQDDFINAWNKLLQTFELQGNQWLQRLFDKRYHWALVYGRNTFSADMSSTQRNESLNNELKGYISVKYDMLTFFEHFDRLLRDKRYEEVTSDFRATQSTPVPKAELTILKQAAKVYTPAVFRLFEDPVLQTLNCDLFYCGDDGSEKLYKVKPHGKHHEHTVKFSPLASRVRCSCKKFEFAGILCSHALKILDINNIRSIPEEYILKRWTIDAKVLHITTTLSRHEDPKVHLSNRYNTLTRVFNRILARAAESEETYSICTKTAEKLAEDIEKSLKISHSPNLSSSSNPQGSIENVETRKPRGIKLKAKEIHGSARPIGGLEKSSRNRKRTKKDPTIMAQAPPHPQSTTMGHLEIPNNQNFMHTSEYGAVGVSVPPHWVNLMSMLQQNQGRQQHMPVQTFTQDFYNMFP